MNNSILKYLLISLITIIFSGCGSDTTSTTYNSDDNGKQEITGDSSSYIPSENPIASTVTTFAQDLAIYDIAGLDETSKKKADGYDMSGGDDSSDDDSSENDGSDDDSSENDDSNDDSSENNGSGDDSSENDGSGDDSSENDGSGDDSSENDSSGDDSSGNDGSGDDSSGNDGSGDNSSGNYGTTNSNSSDDESSDDSSDNNSSSSDNSDDDSSDEDTNSTTEDTTDIEENEPTDGTVPTDVDKQPNTDENLSVNQINPYESFSNYDSYKGKDDLDYKTLGTTNVTLNNKNYRFKIAKDNFQDRVESPSFTSIGEGSYSISIISYIITDDDVLKERDGIFTLQITVPSLNTSGSYKVEANVLTNSAGEDVYALVNISENANGISFNATISEFQVFNRDKTKSYPASFAIQYNSK